MAKFDQALKDIAKYNPKPVRLIIEGRQFEGVEFVGNLDKDGCYHAWLLIKASLEDKYFLDKEPSFRGKGFDLFAESQGEDFLFMGKGNPYKRDEVEWGDDEEEWDAYENQLKAELVYL